MAGGSGKIRLLICRVLARLRYRKDSSSDSGVGPVNPLVRGAAIAEFLGFSKFPVSSNSLHICKKPTIYVDRSPVEAVSKIILPRNILVQTRVSRKVRRPLHTNNVKGENWKRQEVKARKQALYPPTERRSVSTDGAEGLSAWT